MAILSQSFLDSVFFIYRSVAEAESGHPDGASGFFAGIPTGREGWFHLYAVTNRHVVDRGGLVLRFNMVGGGIGTVQTAAEDWVRSDSDDIAAATLLLPERANVNCVDVGMFVAEGDQFLIDLAVGDEAVLVGRLNSHSGRQKNVPLARFGNIAMLADDSEPVSVGGMDQVAFLVDCRSLSGSSGSPVFASYVPHRGAVTMIGAPPARLLGIDCAHLPFWTKVRNAAGEPIGHMKVESNSGIAVVIPSWRIRALLDHPRFREERERGD